MEVKPALIPVDKRFKSDQIFNEVNRRFITLKDEERKQYNVHLERVLNYFVKLMKQSDPMFDACYKRIVYVGSYYEGLKVGKPDEFDLNFIIKVPIDYNDLTVLINSETPGFVELQATSDVLSNLQKKGKLLEYKIMRSWFDEDWHLNQNKFRQWFESVVTKAILTLDTTDCKKYVLIANGTKYLLHHKKSGPAWTLKIDVPGEYTVDVDLVPVLEFQRPLSEPFINRKTKKQNWFTISKPLEGPNNHILWRPSFYERELEILKGKDGVKEVIRQMKKFRDTQNFKSIESYYIKTLFLWELEKQGEDLPKSTACLFFHMLKKLLEAFTKREILDFWNLENNLLGKISFDEMENMRYRLTKIIKTIDNRIADDPYVIAQFILNKDEFDQLKRGIPCSAESWSRTGQLESELNQDESDQLEPRGIPCRVGSWSRTGQLESDSDSDESVELSPSTSAMASTSSSSDLSWLGIGALAVTGVALATGAAIIYETGEFENARNPID